MTNPDNIVRVRARNGGRASVYEANAWCQMLNAGLLEGNGVLQNTSADMNVLVGGSASKPDVVIATAPSGYHVALDIVGQQAVAITAPATNSRISAIVAYTDDLSLATTEDTVTGSPASCGLIVVNGTTSANPTNPTEATIRSAITADGATGSQAAYVVIAYITVSSATTAITNTLISIQQSGIQAQNIQPVSIDNSKLAANAVDTPNIVNSAVTASKIDFTTLSTNTDFVKSGIITGVTFQGTNHVNGGFTTQTYDIPFPSGVTPIVVAVGDVQSGYSASVMITSSTNTGFVFLARTNGTTDVASSTVYWIAINPNALPLK